MKRDYECFTGGSEEENVMLLLDDGAIGWWCRGWQGLGEHL